MAKGGMHGEGGHAWDTTRYGDMINEWAGTHPTGMHSCIELCGSVHTAQRQTPTPNPIGFCTDFIGICVGFCLSCGSKYCH